MIAECCFPESDLYNFLDQNNYAFTHPLTESLAANGMTLSQYASKLSTLSTIAYERDAQGQIKGVVIGYTNNLPEDGGSYITQVVTGMDFRRQGVCARLLREYIDFCRENSHIRYIWMTTGRSNLSAQRSYERVGFIRVDCGKENMVKYVFQL